MNTLIQQSSEQRRAFPVRWFPAMEPLETRQFFSACVPSCPIQPTPPVASLVVPLPIFHHGGHTKTIIITYTDNDPIKLSTIDAGNIVVTSASDQSHLAISSACISVLNCGRRVTVTYTVAAPRPDGWQDTDDGAYDISLTNHVTNLAGQHVTANANFGDFVVAVPDVTVPIVTLLSILPATVTSSTDSVVVQLKITDDVSVSLSSITQSALAVTGPGGTPLVTGLAINSTPDPRTAIVSFTISAPTLAGWTAAENGAYDVALVTGHIQDSTGNSAPAHAHLASFTVHLV